MAVIKIQRNSGGGGSVAWSDITGKPSVITNIQTELDLKQRNPVVLTVSANVTTTSATLSDVSYWQFSVVAGRKYKIHIVASHQTLATTTGLKLGVYLASGAGSIVGYMEGGLSALAVATELKIPITAIGASNTNGSLLLTTGVSAINTKHYIGGNLVFTCTTSGIFRFQIASEINLSGVQLNEGSVIIIEEI